jgi:hypothetical protein
MNELNTEPSQPINTIERHGNVATIKKPEGKYSVAYGLHIEEGQENIPPGVDGICFELASKYPTSDDWLRRAAVANQKPMFDYAERNRLPLLAVDCSIATPVIWAEEIVGPLEFIMGGYLYDKMRERVAKSGMTRREFLKWMLLGGASLYLGLPSVSLVGRSGSTVTGVGEEQTAGLSKSIQTIHPEYKILTLGLRDVVAAQKMEFLLRNGGYKYLLAPRGTEHVGIETAILSQESDRMDFLERLKPVLPKVLPDPETLYQINEYRVNQGKWIVSKQLEEPNLKQLIRH